MDDLGYSGALRQITYDNTYISEPEGYGPGTKFERHKVHDVLEDMLKGRLEGQQYDPVKSSQISKQLADDLREKVRLKLVQLRPMCTQLWSQAAGKDRHHGLSFTPGA